MTDPSVESVSEVLRYWRDTAPADGLAIYLEAFTRHRRRHRYGWLVLRQAGDQRELDFAGDDDDQLGASVDGWCHPDLIPRLFREHRQRQLVCNTRLYLAPYPHEERPVKGESMPDLFAPKAQPKYAAGTVNPAAVEAHESAKSYAIALTVISLRTYLQLCVHERNLPVYARYVLDDNQHLATGSAIGAKLDFYQYERAVADLDAAVEAHGPKLRAAVDALTDAEVEKLIPWVALQGHVEDVTHDSEARPGDVPKTLLDMPAVKDWLAALRLKPFSGFSNQLTTSSRLCPFGWAAFGPRYVGPVAHPSDVHPVVRAWTYAATVSPASQVSITRSSDLANSWRIL